MATSLRQAADSQRSWIAGISVLILVAVLGAALRLIYVEATVPSRIWLDELRPLDTKRSDVGTLVNTEFARKFEGIVADPSFVHGGYAKCVSDIRRAELSGADPAYTAAIQNCLEVVDRALRAAPARPDLWLERARLLLMLDGSQDDVFRALRNSYRTGQREGWVAVKRIPIAIRLWANLPEDLRASLREDVRLAMTKTALIDSVATVYINDFSVRTQLIDLLQETDELAQQRFLEEVTKLRRASGVGIEVKAAPSQASAEMPEDETKAKSSKSAKVEVTAGGEAFDGYPVYRLLADGVPVGSAVAGAAALPAAEPAGVAEIERIRSSLSTSSFVIADIDQIGTLEIEFLNDDWAGLGKPGDRNLWISRISVNGTLYPAASLRMKTNETLIVHDGMAVMYRNGSALLKRPETGWSSQAPN